MGEIIIRFSNLVNKGIIFSKYFGIVLLLYFVLSFYFAVRVYAQGEYLSIWLWDTNREKSASVEVGDILELGIWVNFGDKKASGLGAYLTFDERYFEVINLKGDEKAFKPFDFSGGIFSGGVVDNSTHGDPGNYIPGFQLNAVVVLGSSWVNGQGRYARFQLRAIDKTDYTEIKFDYDRINHRDTGFHEYPLKSGTFRHVHKFTVNIEGIGLEGIPDIFLLPGESDDNTVLNNYLINPPDDLSQLEWSYSTKTDSVVVEIDPSTSRVTYSVMDGWVGIENVAFTVTDALGDVGTDTVSVVATYLPEIINMPDSIIFPEDTRHETPFLDYYVNDLDNPPESIVWSVKSLTEFLNAGVDAKERKIFLMAEKDWFGDGIVVFYTQDPYGAVDSLVMPVEVTPVNDPPVSELPDEIVMRPTQTSTSIVLNDYVYDVDDIITSLSWSYSGNDRIDVSLNEVDNFTATFTPEPGFMDSEKIIFTVTDGKVSTSDTVIVSVRNVPPKITDLPDIIISTDTLIHGYVNLNYYVWDDEPINDLKWNIYGDTIANAVIDSRDSVTFVLSDINQWGVQDVVFTATDLDNFSGSDTSRVVILSDNIPTVWGIPDIVIPVGGSDNSIDLDDYVWDKDTPPDKIEWTNSPTEHITVSINLVTHKVLISSPDPSFVGWENVVFRAADPEGNFREDVITVTVYPGDGTPFIKDIPYVQITRSSVEERCLDEYLVIFPDSLRRNVKWNVSGPLEKVSVLIEPQTNIALFSIGNNPDFLGEVSFNFTATDTISQKSESRGVLVKVVQGNAPILGKIPDITLISGTVDSSISLNPYVRDADTDLDSIIWVVTGNINVTVDISRLDRRKDHKLIIGSKPGFIGKERLIIKAVDTDYYFDVDTITVNVISLTELYIYVFPNPVAGEFVNFVILATDSLLQGPTFEVMIDNNVYKRGLTKIPNLLAWKTDFQFPRNESGTAVIKVEATDRFEEILKSEKNITYGLSTPKNPLILIDSIANLSLEKGSFDGEKIVMMVKEGLKDVAGLREEDMINFENDDLVFMVGYNFAPTSAVLVKPASLLMKIGSMVNKKFDIGRIGIFRGDYYSGDIEYISKFSVIDNSLTVRIDRLGRYFAAVDDKPPILGIKDVSLDERKLNLSIECIERGSGIDMNTIQTSIDGIMCKGFYDTDSKSIEIPFDWDNLSSGRHIVSVQVSDKMGNISKEVSTEFEIEETVIPRSYNLYQNYPNPFNPETTIKYQIPVSANVKMVIYSLLGQKIKTIVDEFKPAGYYSVTWDGGNESGIMVSSGIYICVMESDNFRDSFRMIFLK